MKQLVQNLKTGQLILKDIPIPYCHPKGLLVKTKTSLVSIGTERSIINLARKTLIGKAINRPDLLKKAIDKAKKEGFINVFFETQYRLDEPFPLGYSGSGIICEVGNEVNSYSIGDSVSICGGGFANHAEYNYVPENLCTPLPLSSDGTIISFEEGCFGMVGSICVHGIRQANISPGETVLVIGLGLLGLLTIQLLDSMGCFVIGIDIDNTSIELGKNFCKNIFSGKDYNLNENILSLTENIGVDATIITTATNDNSPIEKAQILTRKKGRIVLVGVSDIKIDRKIFWEKELLFTVSRGDGPGMLNNSYITKGIDYPIEYVRWTKKRNVDYFLKQIAKRNVNIKPLITHRFKFAEAENVYSKILKRKEKYVGVIFNYDKELFVENNLRKLRLKKYTINNKSEQKDIVIGLIGGGMFTKNILLPIIHKLSNVKLKTIATTKGMTCDHLSNKYHFNQSTTDYEYVLEDSEIDTVFITTRHDSHAKYVSESLKSEKNVFVEKPLCLKEKELKDIYKLKLKHNRNLLTVGYNRRFSPHLDSIKKFFRNVHEPKIINYRINAGYISTTHWSQDYNEGGGRIIGEICHFVDLCIYIAESYPNKIFAQGISFSSKYLSDDNIIIELKFDNGSIASILYTAMGSKIYNREFIEIFSGGCIYRLIDFRKGLKIKYGKKQKANSFNKNIGHKNQIKALFSSRSHEIIPFNDIIVGTLSTFAIIESLKKGKPINLNEKIKKYGSSPD